MGRKTILARLEKSFGKAPGVHYFTGDMSNIASYFDYRRALSPDAYFLDETTWYDLDMDDVFKRINPGLTTCGEQYLYYTLRAPALRREDFEERRRLALEMSRNAPLRLKLQYILYRLGRLRNAVLTHEYKPERRSLKRLIFYSVLIALFVSSAAAAFFLPQIAMAAVIFAVFNAFIHNGHLEESRCEFDAVNYSLSMILAVRRIRKLGEPAADVFFQDAYAAEARFHSSVRAGGLSQSTNFFAELFNAVFLFDLVTFERLKNRLWMNRADILVIHDQLGKLDAAIAAASYSESLKVSCTPDIDFSEDKAAYFNAAGMVHPLMNAPVANDLTTDKPVLITGSNASGKSTYIKTAALCAVLAQTIGVVPALSYRASAFRIYTSMAIADDLAAGESYYIAEIKSLKRILDAAGRGGPVFAVIDEVLRGTNTVERIAASTEVLTALSGSGVLCLAATHDVELTALLEDKFALCHFEERIEDDAMTFDYKVKPGPAATRNAIKLLKLMGFDEAIVEKADKRAGDYMRTGAWIADSHDVKADDRT